MLNVASINFDNPIIPINSFFKNVKSNVENVQQPNLLPFKKDNQLNTVEMAKAIKEAVSTGSFERITDIRKRFLKGELDPRKVGAQDYLLGLPKFHGCNYIAKIYVTKNDKGEDCVCLEATYKKMEDSLTTHYCELISFADYDEMIQQEKAQV